MLRYFFMKILLLSGSPSQDSSNAKLLDAIAVHFANDFKAYDFIKAPDVSELTIYKPSLDQAPWPANVLSWRAAVKEADAMILSTPTYLFNIPANLKNALEWLTTSGELDGKPLLALTYTPFNARGKESMQSLLWSLGGLNASIVAQCELHQNELSISADGRLEGDDSIEMILEALKLF